MGRDNNRTDIQYSTQFISLTTKFMAPQAKSSIPSASALHNKLQLAPNSPDVVRILSKLTRSSLLSVAWDWLSPNHLHFCRPFLEEELDENDQIDTPYELASSIDEVREIYTELRNRKGGKKEVLERILEGDWRHGITLYQLAMAETRHLLDHPNSLRWNAMQLCRIKMSNAKSDKFNQPSSNVPHLPRMHAQTFLLNLQNEVSPLTKAHYYLTRVKSLSISLLRVYIHDSPYATQRSLQSKTATLSHDPAIDSAKSLFVIFPDGSPYVFVSLVTNLGQGLGEGPRGLRKLIVEALPKAFSRSHARYELKTSSLLTRSLSTLISLRGQGRGNHVAGGWGIFSTNSFGPNVLEYSIDNKTTALYDEVEQDVGEKENIRQGQKRKSQDHDPDLDKATKYSTKKRSVLLAVGRFGTSGMQDDGKGLERFAVRIQDPFPEFSREAPAQVQQSRGSQEPGAAASKNRVRRVGASTPGSEADTSAPSSNKWTPDVRIGLQGTHVFAGVRQLVEQGAIDGEKMPGWLTGEDGVSIGAVKNGRILRKQPQLA